LLSQHENIKQKEKEEKEKEVKAKEMEEEKSKHSDDSKKDSQGTTHYKQSLTSVLRQNPNVKKGKSIETPQGNSALFCYKPR
jgi:hypothetical protein